jgi:hypothetical protein
MTLPFYNSLPSTRGRVRHSTVCVGDTATLTHWLLSTCHMGRRWAEVRGKHVFSLGLVLEPRRGLKQLRALSFLTAHEERDVHR